VNESRQCRVLYREFLFRLVDRELLSSHSTGDSSRLLLQILTLLAGLSVLLSIPGLFIDPGPAPQAQLIFTWSAEHFLIATTMLAVGIFAVLGWGSMFPDQRDILVLAPLPVRARTIFLAKMAALGTALVATVVTLHVATSLVWPLAFNAASSSDTIPALTSDPAPGSALMWLRLYVAYWLTMLAAGLFVFSVTVAVQGLAAFALPHRYFLRVSSFLQLAVFCVIVGGYFLQPMVVTGATVLEAQRAGFLQSWPSHWFLGLFQSLSGSPALTPLAERAVAGLSLALIAAGGVCALSYVRTLRRMAEEPDIAPTVQAFRHLPGFGNASQTAIVHFSVRTLVRSASHRVIFTFYLGIGFALSMVFLKSPRAMPIADDVAALPWSATSMPLIVSTVVMMVCAVVGARVTFAMPRDLAANWIFRILPVRQGARYVAARRRVFIVLAAGPVWLLSACVLLIEWPWPQAIGHLIVLGLVGATLVDVCLSGAQSIPFTSAYLPGRSHSHVTAPAAVVLLLVLALVGADIESRALESASHFATLAGVLSLVWLGTRVRTSWLVEAGTAPDFDEEPADQLISLNLWDSRLPRSAAKEMSAPP
jgi:hypothetical protein